MKKVFIGAMVLMAILLLKSISSPKKLESDTAEYFSETYMVFGFSSKKNSVISGSVAGIPLFEAQLLLARYPDLNFCRSPGSSSAKKAMRTLTFINASPQTTEQIKAVDEVQDLAMKDPNGKRICVRVQAHRLDPSKPINGIYVNISNPSNPTMSSIVDLESIHIVPCY